jgi:hypothetical protein
VRADHQLHTFPGKPGAAIFQSNALRIDIDRNRAQQRRTGQHMRMARASVLPLRRKAAFDRARNPARDSLPARPRRIDAGAATRPATAGALHRKQT